jgi:predicted ATP-grasp superfamily ATP-dependent carboligase
MRVLLYEYLSGRALDAPATSSLNTEGWAMLAALAEDFAACGEVEPVVLLSLALIPKAAAHWPSNVIVHAARPSSEEEDLRKLAAGADWTLIIAPEFGGILANRCRWIEEAGSKLLGPTAGAVQLTADKLQLESRLRDHGGIPTPATLPFSLGSLPPWPLPWVVKPRDGAGSQATFLLKCPQSAVMCLEVGRAEGWQGEWIVQPYLSGLAASVACLVGARQTIALPAAEQWLSSDGRFHYTGGRLPLVGELCERAKRLALDAVHAVPGLFGYVGVDLVLGDSLDGSADAVIEINPRLTTSYVGLRKLACFNLTEALMAVAIETPLPDLLWHQGSISFHSDGCLLD